MRDKNLSGRRNQYKWKRRLKIWAYRVTISYKDDSTEIGLNFRQKVLTRKI